MALNRNYSLLHKYGLHTGFEPVNEYDPNEEIVRMGSVEGEREREIFTELHLLHNKERADVTGN